MDEWFQQLEMQGPLVGMLLFFLMGFIREWWVTGPVFTRMAKERDDWKALSLKLLNVGESAVRAVEQGRLQTPP